MSGDAAPAQGPATADPFDAPQFDPVEYFNRHFPDEQSLTQLDAFAADLQGRIQGTDTALVESVKTQSVLSARVGGDLQRSWEAMQVLLGRVTEIQQKADDSERMVNDICSDIRALDRGKRNLTLSIKSLERLQMLHSSLQQLQDLVADPDWREVAPLVHVVKRLFAHFAEHKDIPTLQQASAQFTAMQTDFTRKITDQFTAYDPMIDGRAPDNMAHACAVIDAVGPEASKAFMHNFIQNLLEKYQRKFHHGEASAQLMNTNDRYQWFRRLLQCMNDNCPDVFPTDWCLPQELAVEFCLLTNQELTYQLQAEAATLDVPVLVKTLQRSLEFEKTLSNQWQTQSVPASPVDGGSSEDEGNDPMLPEQERIRQKYLRHSRQRQRAERREQRQQALADGKAQDSTTQYKFHGFITSCFDASMHLYVAYEDQQMQETVERLVAEETWGAAEGSGDDEILISASDLFIYVEESLKRSSALSRGATLVQVHEVWCKNLKLYADRLAAKLSMFKGQDRDKEDRITCIIINTADYWSGITAQLADEIKDKIEELSRSEVNLDAAADSFSELINKSIRTLIRSIDSQMEPTLLDMTKMNWAQMTCQDDPSPYVGTLCQILTDRMAEIIKHLSTSYVRLFCNKFIVYFPRRFTQQFYRCRRISDQGCQQLLMDLQHMRQILQNLPNEGNPERFTAASLAKYGQQLSKEVKKSENVLKIVMSPATDKSLVNDYVDLVPHPSVPDFVKLMDLKGMKKSDVGPLIEQLGQNKKVSKTEYVYADEELDVQPQDLGAGSTFANWKNKFGGSMKLGLGDSMKLGLGEGIKIGNLGDRLGDRLGSAHQLLNRT